jgi:zinc and cadmium transporter
MEKTYLFIFLSLLIISLISFVGVFGLFLTKDKLKKYLLFLVSLSAGTLLGGAMLHLMPEIVEEGASESTWLWFLFGIILFFILEKIICWRHCHIPTSDNHPHSIGVMNLIGDALHNFLDGVIIVGAFMISIPLGITVSIAVIAHEIPQEIADFGVLIYAGYTRKKALILNFLISLSAFLGAIFAIVMQNSIENFSKAVIPIAAGGFIYIASADLIPELKKDNRITKSLGQLISILVGIGIMYGLTMVE